MEKKIDQIGLLLTNKGTKQSETTSVINFSYPKKH